MCDHMQARDKIAQTNIIGSLYWYLAGMLEASLKQNDINESDLNAIEAQHQ